MKKTKPSLKAPSRPIAWLQMEALRPKEMAGEVIVEMPVSLTVNGAVWLTMMCTPIDVEALAVGFLFNEGVINAMDEVASVHVCATGDNVDVWLNKPVAQPTDWRRTSGCTGGVTSVDDDAPAPDDPISALPEAEFGLYSAQQIGRLIEALFDTQDLYRASGGVHTSALSDGQRILITGEDIGRHNTLDKIAGRMLMDPPQTPGRVLLTTGRISSEMMQKANHIGAHLVISRTSPSSLSIQLAQQYGVTLIGYARKHRFNVYTGRERIRSEEV